MSAQPQIIQIDPRHPKNPKQPAPAILETAEYLSGISGLPDAATRIGKATTVLKEGIAKGATKTAGIAAKWGWKKFASFCLKVAAASPLIAKIAMGVAVAAVAICVFKIVRAA